MKYIYIEVTDGQKSIFNLSLCDYSNVALISGFDPPVPTHYVGQAAWILIMTGQWYTRLYRVKYAFP